MKKRATSHDLTAFLQFKLHFVQDVEVKYWPRKGWYVYQDDEPPTRIGRIWSDAIEYIRNLSDDSDHALLELSFDALLQTDPKTLFQPID